ncbi:MAG TPA: alpha-L-fucosidase [Puia sp.]|nr:alpha-L-fucosidase [Puia sp.]
MKITIGTAFSGLMLTCLALTARAQQKYVPDPDTAIHSRLQEWEDLKFGLLMHWGTYSQWGIVESWSICPEDVGWATGARKKGENEDNYAEYVKNYEALQKTFNPVKFNPDKWAAAAKEAGMKYMVFTTKHHDGFCMFDTKYTDYKITDPKTPFSTNPRSNVAKEIFNAFRKDNFWIGAYFSKPDWHSDYYWWRKFPPSDRNANYSIVKHPDQWRKFINYTHNQIHELVDGDYGKIDILWLDGGWVRKTSDKEVMEDLAAITEGSRASRNPQNQDINMDSLVSSVRKVNPKIIVVDRAVEGPHQNYLTPENEIPEKGLPYPWETCMTMATSWSYVPNDKYKSADDLIKKLVDVVSKGGNLLLNIGPGPEGDFAPEAYDRLKEIGRWMKVNGSAIYGTRMYSSFSEGENIRYTQSKDGKTDYVFLFDYPETGILRLQKLRPAKKSTITLLSANKKLSWKNTGNETDITLPASLKTTGNHVWVLRVE